MLTGTQMFFPGATVCLKITAYPSRILLLIIFCKSLGVSSDRVFRIKNTKAQKFVVSSQNLGRFSFCLFKTIYEMICATDPFCLWEMVF